MNHPVSVGVGCRMTGVRADGDSNLFGWGSGSPKQQGNSLLENHVIGKDGGQGYGGEGTTRGKANQGKCEASSEFANHCQRSAFGTSHGKNWEAPGLGVSNNGFDLKRHLMGDQYAAGGDSGP